MHNILCFHVYNYRIWLYLKPKYLYFISQPFIKLLYFLLFVSLTIEFWFCRTVLLVHFFALSFALIPQLAIIFSRVCLVHNRSAIICWIWCLIGTVPFANPLLLRITIIVSVPSSSNVCIDQNRWQYCLKKM